MRVKEIYPKIYLVTFRSYTKMCMTFLRFQEHYESPEFKGKIFTLDEFKKWYQERFGKFSYYEDWAGFNLPGKMLKPFFKGKFDPLSKFEKKFLSHFKKVKGRFVVIGCVSGDKITYEHELSHAFFCLYQKYRNKVLRRIREHDFSKMHKYLKKIGYIEDVFEDEINAHMVDGGSLFSEAGINLSKYGSLRKDLRELFEQTRMERE